MLSAGNRLGIRPNLLLTLFLGFTKDPYPSVREAALDGLVGLSRSVVVDDRGLVEACCSRAVHLLSDMEDSIRTSAIRGVIQWGKILITMNDHNTKQDISDALFVQLCAMARDMSVKVRVEAFDALGDVGLVSEDLLLQTLSKKPLPAIREKSYHALCSTKSVEIGASSAAGAFVHGLEDEFCEVRKSACHSLHTLSILSAKFANEALNLLVEVLNDDSMVVRLQALETMRCMALFNYLMLQESHMHMFLSTLVDSNLFVRTAARKVLKVAKLNQMAIFRLCTDGLLENLEMHPQDEADVLSVLFSMGRNHGNFTVKAIEAVLDEIEPSTDGKLGFDNRRIAGLLVLAISAPLSPQQHKCLIPPRIFSYAVTMLGRISHALRDIVDQDTLLVYLSHCSRSDVISAVDFQFPKNGPLSFVRCGKPDNAKSDVDRELLKDHEDLRNPVELIFSKMKEIWKLIQHGFIVEVRNTLSTWKKESTAFTSGSLSSDAIAFTYMYLKVLKVLAMTWPHFLLQRKRCSYGTGNLDLLLDKLYKILREMQHRFIGLSQQEELHVLELILLNNVLRLSTIEAFCESTTSKKLNNLLYRVEFLSKEQNIQLSKFATDLKKTLDEIDCSCELPFYNPFHFRKLLDSFSLGQLNICGKFKHIRAELDFQKNDFENPYRFISGLPIGIPLDITLYNISKENRVWLRFVVDETFTEFVFVDLDRFGGSNKMRKFNLVAPFYKTPRASSFSLKISLGLECLSETIRFPKRCGGPKEELVFLCKEKEVFLSVGTE